MKNYETAYALPETLFLVLLGAIFLVNNRHMLSRSLITDNKRLVKSWYIRSIGKVYPKYKESIPVVRPSFALPSPRVRPRSLLNPPGGITNSALQIKNFTTSRILFTISYLMVVPPLPLPLAFLA